jgi:hypothetical protein
MTHPSAISDFLFSERLYRTSAACTIQKMILERLFRTYAAFTNSGKKKKREKIGVARTRTGDLQCVRLT